MVRPYPQAADFAMDDRAEADIEWLKAMVTALRRVRSELNVPPAKLVTLLLADGNASDRARVERFASQLRFLNKLDHIEFLAHADTAPAAAAAVVGDLRLLVPLEGLVDLGSERARLDRNSSASTVRSRSAATSLPATPSCRTRRPRWSSRSASA
jgi:valyl-tRNA synthetase